MTKSLRNTRRRLALGFLLLVAILAVASWPSLRNGFWAAVTAETLAEAIDPPTAFDRAAQGDILLVDIRRPDEWARTGIPQGALALDMRRQDFVAALQAAMGEAARPVAVICARGVRSAALSNRLAEAGFTDIIDVPEGMLGSRAGPGWLARNLPVRPCPAGTCS